MGGNGRGENISLKSISYKSELGNGIKVCIRNEKAKKKNSCLCFPTDPTFSPLPLFFL